MSATKPPAGYDDRFVVPLEPSRRGAHRARVSPLVGALPVVAVVAVVVAVIVLAWTLFGHSTTDSAANAGPTGNAVATQSAPPATPGATVSTPAADPGGTTTPSHTPTTTKSSTGNKTASVTVLNSTTRSGLAGRVATLLNGKGWTGAHLAKTAVAPRLTTVYYATTEQKPVAESLVADLGLGTVKRSTTMAANGITVVVGTDYP